MIPAELKTALKTLGMPVAYGEFVNTEENPAPSPPFITYQFAYSGNFKADNQNYVDAGFYQVELYTRKKDPVSEKKVQDLFKFLRLPYSKVETYLESEGLRQVVYEIQLIGG